MTVLLELLDGHAGHYIYTSSIMAYAQGRGVFPWTEDETVEDVVVLVQAKVGHQADVPIHVA